MRGGAAIGVNDYNGRYTKAEQTVSEAGEYTLTFTMAQHMDTLRFTCRCCAIKAAMSLWSSMPFV